METFLKINLLLIIFYLMYHWFLEPLKLLKWNRLFLISTLFIAVLLPLFNYEVQQVNVIEKVESNFVYENKQQLSNQSITLDVKPSFEINYVLIFFVLYSLISIYFFIKLLTGLFKIFKLYQAGEKKHLNSFEAVLNDKITEPFSFVKIFLPKQKIDNQDYVLQHEYAHCKQLHFIDNLLINIFLAIFWINPLVWFLKKKIELNLEYLADDYVLTNNNDKKSYQLSLVNFIDQSADFNQISLAFNQPPILKRIKMMNSKANKKSYWKFFLILPILTGFFLFFQQEVKAINVFKAVDSEELENNKNLDSISIKQHLINEPQKSDNTVSEKLEDTEFEKFSKDIKEVNTFKINKNTSQKSIEQELERISKNFDVKLYMNKICIDQDNVITSISITYDDKNGTKNNFVQDNNLGIENVYIKLERPLNSKKVTYSIFSEKQNYKLNEDNNSILFGKNIPTPPTPPMPPTPPSKSSFSGSSSFSNQNQYKVSNVSFEPNKDDVLKEIEVNTTEINKYSTQIQFHSNLINQFSKKINKLTKQYEKNEKEINFYEKEIDKHSKEIDVLSANIDKHAAIIDKLMIELEKE